jgi:hypothetical protein
LLPALKELNHGYTLKSDWINGNFYLSRTQTILSLHIQRRMLLYRLHRICSVRKMCHLGAIYLCNLIFNFIYPYTHRALHQVQIKTQYLTNEVLKKQVGQVMRDFGSIERLSFISPPPPTGSLITAIEYVLTAKSSIFWCWCITLDTQSKSENQ